MNIKIKEMIIHNERKLLETFPEYKQSINQFIHKLNCVKYDKMLYDLIIKSFMSKEKDIQEKKYNSKGYQSARQLVIEYCNNLDLTDNITVYDLKEGNLYTTLEICALSNNYNNQVGMYYIKDLNSVIIKSTVEDNDRPYDDRWIKKNIVLKYFMQIEKDSNINSLMFSNKPNSMIFNCLMDGTTINIYTFINSKKGNPFEFKGIFHPCGLIDGNRAFLLFKNGYDNEIPYDNFDSQFLMTLIKTGICPSINCGLVSRDSSLKINYSEDKNIITSKRNIIQQKKIDLEVDIRGEEIVLQYEKKRLNDSGYSGLAEKVENVSYFNSDLGYDIHSYNIDENGEIIDFFIKVQSLVSINKPILLTKKEYSNLLINPDKYKLYKIYNIYTDRPKLYIINSIKNRTFEANSFLESSI